MHGQTLKAFTLLCIIAIGALFLFWSGLLPQNFYPRIYAITDNLPFGAKSTLPYLEKYEGHWYLEFMSTTKTTAYGDCPSFTSIIGIHDGKFLGHATIPGYVLTYKSAMRGNGVFTGEFFSANRSYQGTMTGTVGDGLGEGTWSDNLDCRGTWRLTKAAAVIDPVIAKVRSVDGRVQLVRSGASDDTWPQEQLYTGDQLQVPSGGGASILLGVEEQIITIPGGTTYTISATQ